MTSPLSTHLATLPRDLADAVSSTHRAVTRDDTSPLVGVLTGSDRGWGPHQRSGSEVLEALISRKMTEFPRWSAYKSHVKRRNDVVHAGSAVDPESAQESLAVVYDLWLWLNDAAQRQSDRGALSPAVLAAVSNRGRRDVADEQGSLLSCSRTGRCRGKIN